MDDEQPTTPDEAAGSPTPEREIETPGETGPPRRGGKPPSRSDVLLPAPGVGIRRDLFSRPDKATRPTAADPNDDTTVALNSQDLPARPDAGDRAGPARGGSAPAAGPASATAATEPATGGTTASGRAASASPASASPASGSPASASPASGSASGKTGAGRTGADRSASGGSASGGSASGSASGRTGAASPAFGVPASGNASGRTGAGSTGAGRRGADSPASDSPASDSPASGRTASGRTAADRMAADRMAAEAAGRTASGRTVGGGTAADRTAAGSPASGRTAGGGTAADRTAADRAAAGGTGPDETAAAEAAAGNAVVGKAGPEKATGKAAAGTAGPRQAAGEKAAAGDAAGRDEADAEAAGADDAGAEDGPDGARRPRWWSLSRAALLIGVLCGLLGFGLAVQVKSNTASNGLAAARQEDLVRILDDLSSREERLRRQISSLEAARSRLTTTGDKNSAALVEARSRSAALGVLAGTVAAQGPGIQLTMTDPQRRLKAEDLLDAVEELRAAGAEAIAVGPVRIGLDSAFTDGDGSGGGSGILTDDQQLTAPYVILAIGDPATLATALNIPGGVVDTVRQAGGQATISQQQRLVIRALRSLSTPHYAQPAE
ncbi:MAG: hypothetical protein V7637_835 [Mycobacteriales bacterium]